MSYESVITALKELMRHEMFEIPPEEHVESVRGESDRAAIILDGAMLERFLVEALLTKNAIDQ